MANMMRTKGEVFKLLCRRAPHQSFSWDQKRKGKSNDHFGRTLGSISDDSITLSQGAGSLRASRAKSYQEFETAVVEL